MARAGPGGVTPRKKLSYIERRKGVAALYLEGWTQAEIGRRYGVAQQTISKDLRAIREQWSKSALLDFHAARIKELERIDRLEREAWRGYRRSQRRRTKTMHEESPGRVVERTEVEQRDGSTDWLATVRWCVEQRCKILGLYEAAKLDVRHDWRERVPAEYSSLAEAFFARKVAELEQDLDDHEAQDDGAGRA